MAIQDLLNPGSRLGSLPAAPNIPIQPIVTPDDLRRSSAAVEMSASPEVLGQRYLGGLQIEAQRRGNQLRLNALSMLPAGSNEFDLEALQEYQGTIGGSIPIREDGKADIDKIRETLGARKALAFIGGARKGGAAGGLFGGNELPPAVKTKILEELTNSNIPVLDPATGFIYDDATLMALYQNPENYELIQAHRPKTQTQADSETYGKRMGFNNRMMEQLSQAGFDPTGFTLKNLVNAWGPNALKSDMYQTFEAVGKNWIAAMLRRESGAAISDSEYKNGEKQYLPRLGDKPLVLETKRRLRQLAEQLFLNASGDPRLYKEIDVDTLVPRGDFGVDENGAVTVPVGTIVENSGNGYVKVTSPLGSVQYVPEGEKIVNERGQNMEVVDTSSTGPTRTVLSAQQMVEVNAQPPIAQGIQNSDLLTADIQDSPRTGKWRAVMADGSFVPLTKEQVDAIRALKGGSSAGTLKAPVPAALSPATVPINSVGGVAGIYG